MPATKISDIIVPAVFNPYVIERTAELSTFYRAGIIARNALLDKLASAGGKLINMPFFQDLTGADEVLTDLAALSVNAIGTEQDVAVLHMRGKAWGVNDLAEALSGDDPMGAIGNLVGEYWARRFQDLLISILKGVFADNIANDGGDLVHSIFIEDGDTATDANKIGAEAIINAWSKLGDNAMEISAISMHSAIYKTLQIANLISFIPDNKQDVGFGTYLDKTVIVNDTMPRRAGTTSGYVCTCFLYGAGAIGWGEGGASVPTETDRDSLAGEDVLINRRHFVLHPRGIKFLNATVAGEAPTNAECELATNWDRVYEKKNIRLVELLVNEDT